MKCHSAATALPDMGDDEYKSLRDDIASHGLLVPIELLDGKIIDGRHRFKACKELKIEPSFVDVKLNGQSAAEYVWSLNGARRHLSASQRAAVAVDLLPDLKKEAKERQKRKPKSVKGKIPEQTGQSRDKAASIVGVDPTYVSAAETIKNESPALFEEIKTGKTTVSKAKKKLKKAKKEAEDKEASKKAEKVIKDNDANGVYHGDSFELAKSIPDASCALVFTDPPYDRDSLWMFEDLGMLASKILVEGGSLITYCGQYVVREVIELVAPDWTMDDIDEGKPNDDWRDDEGECVWNDLKLFWINCCLHTGGTAQMREYGIKVKWKPMLWFVKGDFRRDRETWVDDLVVSNEEKNHHPWQQSVAEAKYYIDKLTKHGELVVDPFCGGGTTAIAAKQLGRKWWTADVDAKHVATARKRLDDQII